MKNSQIAGGVLAGIILTLGWLYFWGFQLEVHPTALTPDRGSLIASDAPSGSVLSPEDESLPDFGTTPKDQRPPENGSLDSREPVQPELVLMGVVRNSSGHPLSDALVSWSPAERLRSFTPVPPGSWEDQAASMRHFETTASGEFQFPFPQGHGGGILWATKKGYKGQFLELASHAVSDPNHAPCEFTLPSSGDINVTVKRLDGNSIGAYSLIERGRGNDTAELKNTTEEDRAKLLFLRTQTERSDTNFGTARLPEIGSRVWIHAETETLVSSFEVGDSDDAIELILRPSFTIAVRLLSGGTPLNATGATVSVFPWDGIEPSDIYFSLNESGFAEAKVPIVECSEYTVRITGGGFSMDTQDFARPQPGDRIEIDFVGTPVEDLATHFTDIDESPVKGVESYISWTGPDGIQQRSAPLSRSDVSGFAVLHSLPTGPFWILYSHVDFVDGFRGPYYLEDMTEPLIEVELTPFGVVTGQVIAKGKVLKQYQLFRWSGDDSATSAEEVDLAGHIDDEGIFKIQLPSGDSNLMAWAEDFAHSATIAVTVESRQPSTIEFELPSTISGSGIVLDEVTRKPIPNALLWVALSSAGLAVAYNDEVGESDANGEFIVTGFSPNGLGLLTVEAEGYASASFSKGPTETGDGPNLNFGQLLLARQSQVQLSFVSDAINDWSNYSAEVTRSASTDSTKFLDPNGTVLFEGIEAGVPRFSLYAPDGLALWIHSEPLTGYGPWELEVNLEAGNVLEVLVPEDSRYEEGPLYVSVAFASGTATSHSQYRPLDPKSRVCTLQGLPTGTFAVFVLDSEFTRLACATVTVEPNKLAQVTLRPGSPKLSVLLEDSSGSPIPLALIIAGQEGHPGSDTFSNSTDESGVADLGVIPYAEGMLMILGAEDGCMSHVPFSIPSDGSPLRVIWDADLTLSVRAMDRGEQIVGAKMEVDLITEPAPLYRSDLDEEGILTYAHVSDVDYKVSITSPWVWPQSHVVRAGNGSPVNTEFRRRGDLQITLQTSTGIQIAGALVTLESLEFKGQSPSDWLDQGLISTSTGSFETDSSGRLKITGLPNGLYSWSAPESKFVSTISVAPMVLTDSLGVVEK